jgi:HTH-type transcriptional regulator, sugar sensing transcriptional regulator
MYEKLLRECGLTQNESLVYLALLRIGKARSGEIVKEAKISGGKVYETLYKLIDKGLVKSVSENKVKHFIANEPSTLISYVKEREKLLHEKEMELEKILPGLKELKRKDELLETVSLVKGLRGISSIMYKSLEGAGKVQIMGVRSGKNVRYNNFWSGWHRERVILKKRAKIIFSDRDTEYWKHFRKQKFTEVRNIDHFTPSAIMIVDDESFIFSYGEEITCIHITSKAISDSFSEFFMDLWKISK